MEAGYTFMSSTTPFLARVAIKVYSIESLTDACCLINHWSVTAVVTILNDLICRCNDIVSLCIQIDGASENWNQFVLAYCQLLLESGKVRQEVLINRKNIEDYDVSYLP